MVLFYDYVALFLTVWLCIVPLALFNFLTKTTDGPTDKKTKPLKEMQAGNYQAEKRASTNEKGVAAWFGAEGGRVWGREIQGARWHGFGRKGGGVARKR